MKEYSKHDDTGITPVRISAKLLVVCAILIMLEALAVVIIRTLPW